MSQIHTVAIVERDDGNGWDVFHDTRGQVGVAVDLMAALTWFGVPEETPSIDICVYHAGTWFNRAAFLPTRKRRKRDIRV